MTNLIAYLGYAYGAVNWYYVFADGQEYSKGFLMLESNFRFYNGLWLGIGIVLLWLIPRVEREKTTLRVIAVCLFCGGIGRLFSRMFTRLAMPLGAMVGAFVSEHYGMAAVFINAIAAKVLEFVIVFVSPMRKM